MRNADTLQPAQKNLRAIRIARMALTLGGRFHAPKRTSARITWLNDDTSEEGKGTKEGKERKRERERGRDIVRVRVGAKTANHDI